MYIPAKVALWNNNAEFAGGAIFVILVMSNTTADTDNTAAVITDFGTLDEFDGSGYSRTYFGIKTVTLDASNRAKFDGDDIVFGALGNGTRQIVGCIIVWDNGADAASIPLIFIDYSAAPIDPGGAEFSIEWPAGGIAYLTG